MADFKKKITITVDLVTGSVKNGLGDFKQAIAGAEGPINKLKAGTASLGTSLKGIPWTAVAGGAALAGTAVTKFAVDAVNDFANAGVAASELATATGLSTEAASRWIAVADDFGVGAENIEASLGRLGREAGNNPEKFDRLGVAIARTESGAVDMNGTFLNTIERLQAIENPAERAAAAQDLLGRSWQNLAPILQNTRGELESMLGAVSDAQVITDAEAERAREWKLALDDLQDTVGDVGLELGGTLAPALTETTEIITESIGWVRSLAGAFGAFVDVVPGASRVVKEFAENAKLLIPGYGNVKGVVDGVSVALDGNRSAWDRTRGGMQAAVSTLPLVGGFIGGLVGPSRDAADAADEVFDSQANMAAQMLGTADAADSLKTSIEAGNAILDQQAANTRALGDAWAAAEGDITGALDAAAEAAAENEAAFAEMNSAWETSLGLAGDFDKLNDEFLDGLAELPKALEEATESARDDADAQRNRGLAIREVMDQGIALAQSETERRIATLEATGATVSAADAARIQREELLKVAATADGPVRDALLFHIQTLADIPPEVATEIAAAIAEGDLAEAQRLLDEATRGRTVPVEPELAGETEFENDLAHLTRERQMLIRGILSGTVPLEGGSLHLTDLETGEEKGVIPDEHMLELNVESTDAVTRIAASRQALEAARQAAKDAGQDFTSSLDVLETALDDLDTAFRLGGLNQQQYLQHLRVHLAAYDEFSLEWISIAERIMREEQRIDQERTRAQEAALRERQQLTDSVRGQFAGAGAIAGFEGAEGEDVTAAGIAAFIQGEAAKGSEFQHLIERLRKTRLHPKVIEALGQAGPDAIVVARALAAAHPGHIEQINRALAALFVSGGITAAQVGRALGIPGFQQGGVFHAPQPGGAGLAILHDGERVIPRGKTGGDTYNQQFTINRKVDEREVVDILRTFTRRNGELRLS